MTIAVTIEQKFKEVKDAYLNDILPGIQVIYEKTAKAPEAFILAHCAILNLSGFYTGANDTNKRTYKEFIKGYFPKSYNPDHLYFDIRCNLIHAYTIPKLFILTSRHQEWHLKKITLKSDRTGKDSRFTFLSFENFYADLLSATQNYFKEATNEKDLLDKLSRRYDNVPPNVHVAF